MCTFNPIRLENPPAMTIIIVRLNLVSSVLLIAGRPDRHQPTRTPLAAMPFSRSFCEGEAKCTENSPS